MSPRASALVAVLALATSAVFYAASEGVNRNDASLYFQIAKNVAEGNGFSSMTQPPHNWVGSREALYPLMLSLPFRVFGASLTTVFVVQAVLHALTALLAGRLAMMLVGSARVATAAAVIVAVFPTLANYTVYTMRETFFTFLVTLATSLTISAAQRASWPRFATAGATWGAAILCRGVVLPLPVVLGGLVILLAWRGGARVRRTAARDAIVLVAFTMLPMLAWGAYTAHVNAEWSATPRAWQNIYVRASKVALTNEEMKMYALYCLSESIADRVFPGNNLRSVGEGYFYRGFAEKLHTMRAAGMDAEAIGRQVRREALTLMIEHPVLYAATGVFELVKFNSFFQVPVLNEQGVEARYGGSLVLLGLRGVFKLAGFLLLAPLVVGAYAVGRHGALLLAVVVYFNLVHMGLDSIARYAVPVIPCYLLFALVAARHLLGHAVRASERAPGALAPAVTR